MTERYGGNGTGPGADGGATDADAALAAELRVLLRASEKEVDFIHGARLSAARARAVEQVQRPAVSLWRGWTWTVPGSAFGAAMLVWLLLPRLAVAPVANPAAPPMTQAEVLETLSDDKVPAVSEDLDFYQWLADSNAPG